MAIDESVWQLMKERLGYNDEEMKKFRENPRNSEVLAKAQVLSNKTIVAEVVESKNCNSQHKVGDRFIFDAVGNLLTSKNPKRICIFALERLASMIFAIDELIYAGVDPNESDGTYTNLATLNARDYDGGTALLPQMDEAYVAVESNPSMGVNKSVNVNNADPGENITFTLRIDNFGSTILTIESVVDTIPPGFSLQSQLFPIYS